MEEEYEGAGCLLEGFKERKIKYEVRTIRKTGLDAANGDGWREGEIKGSR